MDLSTTKIGFIGAGNMAQALAKGVISSGLVKSELLWASAPSDGTLNIWKTWGCHTDNDNGNQLSGLDSTDIQSLILKQK